MNDKLRINYQIQAKELRVILENGDNLGVLTKEAALDKAKELGLDIIEISPNANPPIAKIMDYGKFEYALNKKLKAQKTKSKAVELKSIQIKVGTGDHDLELKAKQITNWLKDGNRVRVNLFLPGRTKYMNEGFLNERMERLLKFIAIDYKIADKARKSPKGLGIMLEKK